jgi:hypothetical protein
MAGTGIPGDMNVVAAGCDSIRMLWSPLYDAGLREGGSLTRKRVKRWGAAAIFSVLGHAAEVSSQASVLIESEPGLQILVLTRFLHAKGYPLRWKTL